MDLYHLFGFYRFRFCIKNSNKSEPFRLRTAAWSPGGTTASAATGRRSDRSPRRRGRLRRWPRWRAAARPWRPCAGTGGWWPGARRIVAETVVRWRSAQGPIFFEIFGVFESTWTKGLEACWMWPDVFLLVWLGFFVFFATSSEISMPRINWKTFVWSKVPTPLLRLFAGMALW